MAASGDDCPFYYTSSCKKESQCPFRHSKPAKFCSETCKYWRDGRCAKRNCSYRHSDASPETTLCFYHETRRSGCTRIDCPYLHLELHGEKNQYQQDLEGSDSDIEVPLNAPGKPWMIHNTPNSIILAWTAPDDEYKYAKSYKIGFRECRLSNSEWMYVDTGVRKTTFTVNKLKAEREYEFKICTVNAEGEQSVFSELSDRICTLPSMAMSIKRDAVRLRQGYPEIYKIPLEIENDAVNSDAKTKKCYFGKKRLGAKEKTIILVGATGSGKSTLLDGIINYVTGVSWEDDFRFSMVELSDNEKTRHVDQTLSQTEWITCYTIRTMAGSNLDYDLHVIDTPGFGDTLGIERDKMIKDRMREFFTTIMYLDAVCFVVQAPLARLTTQQRYLFDAVLSIFGQDIADNIYVLVTFADNKDPPVLDALKVAKVPYKKAFKFNNSALFASLKRSDESQFESFFWQMGKESFDMFFSELRFVETKSLQLTTDVLNLSKNLQATIDGLQPQIQEGANVLNTLRQEERILQKHKDDIDANKTFRYDVDEIVKKKIYLDTGTYVTNCSECKRTCHFPCKIQENKEKKKCSAIRKGYCTVCPGKCSWDSHQNNDFVFVTSPVKVKRSYKELKQKYKTAKQQKEKQLSVIEQVRHTFNSIYQNVLKMMRDVRSYINKLDKIALRRNPLTDVDYIDLLMESEKSEKKYGWQERLKLYKKMREEAEIVLKASSRNIKPWGDVGDVFKGDK